MSPKVRDLAESRTGVLASMYIAIARGKYYKYALAARGGSRFNRLLYCGFRWAYPLSCSIAPPKHPTIYDHQSQLLICLQ